MITIFWQQYMRWIVCENKVPPIVLFSAPNALCKDPNKQPDHLKGVQLQLMTVTNVLKRNNEITVVPQRKNMKVILIPCLAVFSVWWDLEAQWEQSFLTSSAYGLPLLNPTKYNFEQLIITFVKLTWSLATLCWRWNCTQSIINSPCSLLLHIQAWLQLF